MASDYPRVELCPNFLLERYLGWTVLEQEARLKLMARRLGPARRLVLLSDGGSLDAADAMLRSHRAFRPATMLTVNEFQWRDGDPERAALGHELTPVLVRNWFGAGTYAFDLSQSEETLFANISSRERSKIRKSERLGLRTEFLDRVTEADLDRVVALYDAMARERGLSPADRPMLRRMIDEGFLVFGQSVDADGRPLTINLVYVLPTHAYYYVAVHDSAAPEPGGHLLIWKTLQYLKQRGVRWYDFGLVSSMDSTEGIHRFKKCFGGRFEPSGREWQNNPAWMERTVRVLRRVNQWRVRATS